MEGYLPLDLARREVAACPFAQPRAVGECGTLRPLVDGGRDRARGGQPGAPPGVAV